MAEQLHAFDYLESPSKYPVAPVNVVYGDEPFLKRLAIKALRSAISSDEDTPFATFDGDATQWRDVLDELSTVALFGGGDRRLAVIEQADSFVTKNRERLEAYVEKPRSTGVLILEVNTWLATTRLYKAVAKTGLAIACRAPTLGTGKSIDRRRVATWLVHWAKQRHDAVLEAKAAALLLDLVGFEFGLLDQELAKLALFVGIGGTIRPELVQDVVGGWKAKTVWELMDAACDGNAAEALRHLDLALQAGEPPIALFGQIAWSLRRFANATRIFQRLEREGRRPALRAVLEQAGFRDFPRGALASAENQLKQLRRDRAGKLHRWLLEADLAMKGSHSSPELSRLVLEQLILRLARTPEASAAGKPTRHG